MVSKGVWRIMKVLVACEFSGGVRDAFIRQGHDAVSCDLIPSESPGPHIQGNVLEVINSGEWDLMIAHPPCTHLAVSGARWFKDKPDLQREAIQFFMDLVTCEIPKVCIENPVGIMSTVYRKPNQYIQPWGFGHPESKKTGLWLRGLPNLIPTNNVKEEYDSLPVNVRNRIHYLPPTPDRGKLRSRTYPGIAEAMANQWSNLF